MADKQSVARNALWNWAGAGVEMGAGFCVAPFLVSHLGETTYGLWILMASLSGYFGLLDLGIRGSVGRQLAFCRAQNDQQQINSVLSTALAALFGSAVVGLLGSAVFFGMFFKLFDVPPDRLADARIALVLVSLHLPLMLVFSLFDATLWAYQRFDRLNAIDIPCVLARAGLTIYCVGHGGGLLALAVVTCGMTIVAGIAKLVATLFTDPKIRVSMALVRRDSLRDLLGYGMWSSVISISRLITMQISPLIVGASLAVALVTPFSIAFRIVSYVRNIFVAGTGILTPLLTELHATRRHDEQRRLYLLSSRACLAGAFYCVGALALLGRPLIRIWIGAAYEDAATLLVILAIGEVIPLSQWVTNSMAFAMARHRTLAIISIVEAIAILGLASVLVPTWKLVGICLAIAIPGFICRGLIQMIYGCRLIALPWGEYLRRSICPAALVALAPTALLALLIVIKSPTTWLELIGYAAISVTSFAISFGAVNGKLTTVPSWLARRTLSGRRLTTAQSGAASVVISQECGSGQE